MLQVSSHLHINPEFVSWGIDREILENSYDPKDKEILSVLNALESKGYNAVYGWHKGRGFWIQRDRHTLLISNGQSGNECFFMLEEAIALTELPI